MRSRGGRTGGHPSPAKGPPALRAVGAQAKSRRTERLPLRSAPGSHVAIRTRSRRASRLRTGGGGGGQLPRARTETEEGSSRPVVASDTQNLEFDLHLHSRLPGPTRRGQGGPKRPCLLPSCKHQRLVKRVTPSSLESHPAAGCPRHGSVSAAGADPRSSLRGRRIELSILAAPVSGRPPPGRGGGWRWAVGGSRARGPSWAAEGAAPG